VKCECTWHINVVVVKALRNSSESMHYGDEKEEKYVKPTPLEEEEEDFAQTAKSVAWELIPFSAL